MDTESKRGGTRPGAGRPKKDKHKEPTHVMRVPVSLVQRVQEMIDRHNRQQGQSAPPDRELNARPAPSPKKPKEREAEIPSIGLRVDIGDLGILPKAIQQAIIREYGSLERAHRAGVKAEDIEY
jgi:hypothetical protein